MRWMSKFLVVAFAFITTITLFIINFFFPHSQSIALVGIIYGSNILTALLFLAVGSLVFLYGKKKRQRENILLVFFCWSMIPAIAIAMSPEGSLWMSFGSATTMIAIMSFLLFLCFFPLNIFDLYHPMFQFWFRSYIGVLLLCGSYNTFVQCLGIGSEILTPYLKFLVYIFDACAPLTCILLLIHSYRMLPPTRRQSLRYMVIGTVFSVGSTFLFMILPFLVRQIFHVSLIAFDSPFAFIFFAPLPLILGYTLLRNQLLLDDKMQAIRPVILWSMSITLTSLFAYVFLIALISLGKEKWLPIVIICLIPPLYWVSNRLTQWLFRLKFNATEQLIQLQNSGGLDFEGKLSQIVSQIRQQIEHCGFTSLVFLYDEDHDQFLLIPSQSSPLSLEMQHYGFLKQEGRHSLLDLHIPSQELTSPRWLHHFWKVEWLHPLKNTMRPILVPIRTSTHLVGLVVLAEREEIIDSDLDRALHLLKHFALLLERTRLEDHLTQHIEQLRDLLTFTLPSSEKSEPIALAQLYALAASNIFDGSCTIWLSPDIIYPYWQRIHVGESISHLEVEDMEESEKAQYLSSLPHFDEYEQHAGQAVLLLSDKDGLLGILHLITESRSRFSPTEKRILNVFAIRCSYALRLAHRIEDLAKQLETIQKKRRHLLSVLRSIQRMLSGQSADYQSAKALLQETVARIERAPTSPLGKRAMQDVLSALERGLINDNESNTLNT